MIPGVGGRLLTSSFIRDVLPGLTPEPPREISRALTAHAHRIESSLGTASSVRAVTDVALLPLLELLELTVVHRRDDGANCWLRLAAGSRSGLVAIVTPWAEPLDAVWRSSVAGAIDTDARWCFCCNGKVLRLIDTRRTWSRDYLEFDLALLGQDADVQHAFWAVASAGSMSSEPPLLDRAIVLSARYGAQVCRTLGAGVLDALDVLFGALGRHEGAPATVLWEQALTVLYRILFLLFAEARGLVPVWHPLYRDRYSLETIVVSLLEGRPCRGLWRAVQAISRLAHSGCSAGDLRVTAFNGRLFAPAQATAFDRTRLSDATMSRAVVALSTTPVTGQSGRTRIAYRDLDVEELGAVYERVLEYEPTAAAPSTLTRSRDTRKATGTFYTPRRLTALLVRRTLEPLVCDRSAGDILRLRILDPAMGSGAFLVASCRYLAAAVETALVREGRWHGHDVTPFDRASLRREVASRCLFGVDLNPMAVQLARLSLWLATLAEDKPLSFLDHHLVAGNSLVGATPEDVGRQPAGGQRSRRPERLPLFDAGDLPSALEQAAHVLTGVANEPDDSAEIVRSKERRLLELRSSGSRVDRWTRALDLWCAGWFWRTGSPPDRGTFLDLMARLLDRPSTLPARTAAALLEQSHEVSGHHRFLHWPLVFPDVFSPSRGASPSGFDAIVGNPPWDMVRGDSGVDDTRSRRQITARQMSGFVRESGIYQVESRAHLNLYQLFLERALQLVRPGGRIGFVLPSGLVSDPGAAPFRRHLLDRADIDEVTGFDNRHAIFPVHRSVRFVLLTCSPGRPTTRIQCRFGLSTPEEAEAPTRAPLVLSRRLLARLSGDDDLAIPELPSDRDLAIVEAVAAAIPRLGSAGGWHVTFGRELNASDDRALFAPATGDPASRPVVQGKMLEPFRVATDRCRLVLRPDAEADVRIPRRARLAYRDVASATNRLTLIAAIVPARAITTHTLFCLRTNLPAAQQRVLCALLNTYVANYLVRLRVNTHVTVSLVSRLPVPVVEPAHPAFDRLSALSEILTAADRSIEEMDEYHELQALAARLYGLSAADFEHVLGTFPLVPYEVRRAALNRFAGVAVSSLQGHGR